MIVLLDPAGDGGSRFFQAAILGRPDFLFLQAAMEPFDVAIALRVMIRRASMHDAQPCQRFHKPRRDELRSVIGGERQASLAAALGQPCEHGLLSGYKNLVYLLLKAQRMAVTKTEFIVLQIAA